MLIFEPMLIATDSEDEEGHLALYNGKLVGVFVRLAGAEHLEERGRLYLEAAFGQLEGLPTTTFADLDEAARWVETELEHPCGEDPVRSSFGKARPTRA
ncbi:MULTISPECIES: hypothetical protein [unclassified Aureimonas]|uniref:hypothetical protein n=1 Tax=unclassified Aureimonas TaxID=2615206 RepID=UPI0006FCB9A0|nr:MULTISPECIES: hypothetical protein [unclassified Aureimonas]KQT53920.1 hypothetical protein ASG62_11860 [Aureimonas sp. Leaf427]KQT71640.1 hypothetical protein ASG54_19300 [Aureimonas sp. Leaf460]